MAMPPIYNSVQGSLIWFVSSQSCTIYESQSWLFQKC
jgi:hypothetical protein